MGGISFDAYPRRVVKRPGGGVALVSIRRNGPKIRWMGWGTPYDLVRIARWVWRVISNDRSWQVEVYEDVSDDVQLPYHKPQRAWVLPDKRAAVNLAEAVCDSLRTQPDLPDA